MENQLIQLYLLVCQIYDNQSYWKYQRLSNFKPSFTDQELITIRSYAVERKINNLRAFLVNTNRHKSFIFNKVMFNSVSTA